MRKSPVFLVLLAGLVAVAPGAPAEPDLAEAASHLLDKAPCSRGLCVVFGEAAPMLALELARQSDFLVHVLGPPETDFSDLRETALEEGLSADRLLAENASLDSLPHATHVVDFLVAADPSDALQASITSEEALRVLRPRGWAVIVNLAAMEGGPSRASLRAWARDGDAEKDAWGTWVAIERPPLEGADDWSHWEHGPDNNPVSTDQVIKAPYLTQWTGAPYYITMPSISTAAGGRTFLAMGHIAHHEREERWINTLLARNGYNGTQLWERRLPEGYLMHRSAFVATAETFYLIDPLGDGCLLLDPETGREKGRIRVPEAAGHWKWMALVDGVLFALAGDRADPPETTVVRSQYPAWSWGELSSGYYTKQVPWGFGRTILAYDLKRDKLRWLHEEDADVDSRAMAIGDGDVYFYGPASHAGRLNGATGKVLWTNDDAELRDLIEQEGVGLGSTPGFRSMCFCVYTPEAIFYEAQTRANIVAVSKDDGALLWHKKKTTNNPNVIYLDGNVLVGIGKDGNTLVVDPLTGEVKQDLDFKKRSCSRLTATPDSLFCRGWPEGTTRYDRNSGVITFDGAMRPACNDGVIGANGLLYNGPWPCDCNLSVMGAVAYCSAAGFEPEQHRGERVAAADKLEVDEAASVSGRDWYAYRGGNDHTGATRVGLSKAMMPLWTWEPPYGLACSAPTTGGGLIFFGADDGYVRALDAATGELKWSFATAGPVLQPPSIWRGRAYVGSGDGHAYALEAATGRLLWKFRAAPFERRTMIYEHLASTWPVNTGVLIHNGVAHFAAGIIDTDGTYLYAVDAETGELRWCNNTSGHLSKGLRKGVSAQGNLAVAGDMLWLAGGNVVSPAPYDLETGDYHGPPPGDGSPRTNRGEEIGVFWGDHLLLGGKLRYSVRDNIVNPGRFVLAHAKPGGDGRTAVMSQGRVVPVWDDATVIALSGREAPPSAFDAPELRERLQKQGISSRAPKRMWTSKALDGSQVLAMALAGDAVLVACKTPQPRQIKPRYRLCLLDREKGRLRWEHNLPTAPTLNGLAVDRQGRVIVPMEDGSVSVWGDHNSLLAMVEALSETAKEDEESKKLIVGRLRTAMNGVKDTEERRALMNKLAQYDVDVLSEARENGAIHVWNLLGPVPWDRSEQPLDTEWVGEPNVNLAKKPKVDGEELAWAPFMTTHANGMIDLTRVYGVHEWKAIYAYAEFELAEAADLLLKIGSNDGFKCWLNGEEVGRFDGGRAYAPDQDSLEVQGRKGVNKLLLKITQHGGGWALGARLTDRDGKPVEVAQALP